jgi:hypothetical protein
MVFGFKASAPPPEGVGDFTPSKYTDATLPAKVDLRPFMTPVEHQGTVRLGEMCR